MKLLPLYVKILNVFKYFLHRYREIIFKPYIMTKVIEGIEFKLLIGDWIGQDWYRTKNEWLEMRFMRDQLIEEGDVVIECGGHHGCSAILLSKWVGQGKVMTFEPIANNVDIINKNLAINDIENVTVKQCAVGNSHDKVIVTDFSCASVVKKGKRGVEVDTVMLDDYIAFKPTLLKIDVEGYEVEVLKGAKNILKTLPKLAIEIHTDILNNYGTSVEELLSLLDLNTYECWIQWEDDSQPEKYNKEMPILHRVHFFAFPVCRPSS